jgi:hypothetical protein
MKVLIQDLLVLIPFLPALVAWVSFSSDDAPATDSAKLQSAGPDQN